MTINSKTLKNLRTKRGLSQQALADLTERNKGGKVSKRTITRLEKGENGSAQNVRRHTIQSLARALGVQPEDICKPYNEIDDAWWKARGYTPLQVLLDEPARLNYRWVLHHYGLSLEELIDAAPWMFALLAKMSLAERRRQLLAASTSFDEAMDQLPRHLGHGSVARSDFEHAYRDEDESIAARDILGKQLLETDHMADPFDPSVTNPFVEFVRKLATEVGSDEIDPDCLELPYGGGIPRWPVFQMWLNKLTGGDEWAQFAVENVRVGLHEMPVELKNEARTSERIAWLIDRIPAEVREREERRRAEKVAEWEKLEIEL